MRALACLVLLLVLGACAPLQHQAGVVPPGFAGPRLEPYAIIASDGVRLPLDVWPARDANGVEVEPWAVIIGLHGMNDYAETFRPPATLWAVQGITTWAYDQRGFGRGEGRGVWGNAALMRDDLRCAVTFARARHPHALIAVVGESMGGAVAITAFASDHPPAAADRLVLVSPAVWGWGEQPVLNNAALWIAAHTVPDKAVTAPAWVTRRIRASDNIEMLRRLGRDRNMIFATRVDAIFGLVSLMSEAQAKIGAVKGPVLLLSGAHDQVIPPRAMRKAAAKLPAGARTAFYSSGYHMLTRDRQGDIVSADIAAWLRDPAAPLPSGAVPMPKP